MTDSYDDLDGQITADGIAATAWAKALLAANDWVVLDTETTGLGETDEIVQIAVVAPDGAVLLDTLVKPTIPIPAEATGIHGITDAMVLDAEPWSLVLPKLLSAVGDRRLVVYHASFDRRLMRQSSGAGWKPLWAWERWECAMEQYAAWYGDWNDSYEAYRWQRLPGGGHTAASDCLAVLALLKRMAEPT